jgi:hypothetical protein
MKFLFYFIIHYSASHHANHLICDTIKSGTYQSVYDKEFQKTYINFELTINDTSAIRKERLSVDVYNIQRVSQCNYILRNQTPLDTTNLNHIQKQLASLGQPFYEIQFVNSDTLKFVFRQNLHLKINSGILVKKK